MMGRLKYTYSTQVYMCKFFVIYIYCLTTQDLFATND